jgi:histone deacetylase 6
VNIPWAEPGTTDADYIHAFQQIVMPIATEFAPELVISKFWGESPAGKTLNS